MRNKKSSVYELYHVTLDHMIKVWQNGELVYSQIQLLPSSIIGFDNPCICIWWRWCSSFSTWTIDWYYRHICLSWLLCKKESRTNVALDTPPSYYFNTTLFILIIRNQLWTIPYATLYWSNDSESIRQANKDFNSSPLVIQRAT